MKTKNLIKAALIALVAGVGMTSCSSDDDDDLLPEVVNETKPDDCCAMMMDNMMMMMNGRMCSPAAANYIL